MAEPLPAVVWIAMPVLIAAGAALLTAVLMQARMEVAVARQRAVLAEARALLATQHRAMEERIRAVEESARRKALEELMADIRVEERQLMGERKSLLGSRKYLVLQERVCFRNIPLTQWTERELPGVTAVIGAPAPPPQPRAPEPVLAEIEPAQPKLLR